MADRGLIDWSRPWSAPYAEFRSLLESDDPRRALTLAAERLALRTRGGLPVRFVAAADAGTQDYEEHIARTGRVPTRDCRHDLLNALAWLAFPCIKAALNEHHVTHRNSPSPASDAGRGPARDAATLLDENGLLLACADPALAADLAAMRWSELFVDARGRFGASSAALPLGHALIDKLARPFKAICAHAWVVAVEPALLAVPAAVQRAHLDRVLGERLAGELQSPRMLLPLPVLGIPGWWPPNQEPDFYDDRRVFRPAPRARC